MTNADFERLSWHDNLIYGWAFETADPDAGDWRSELALDIDHIVEWVRTGERMRFRVAPAQLVFHGVTGFACGLDWGASGDQVGLQLPSIDRVEREPITEQRVFLDRPYYRWRIVLNAPAGGYLSFGAVDFTQTLRTEPVLQDEQWLAPAKRCAMLDQSR